MQISRRRRPLDRTLVSYRDARLVVVATEGQLTEPRYFGGLRFPRTQVEVIPSRGGRSSPRHILSNLARFEAEYDLGEDDELWVVLDLDRWPVRALHAVHAACTESRYNLAVSNPCFEIWLALHFDEPLPNPVTANSLVQHLRGILGGYNKAALQGSHFHPQIGDAIERARAMDDKPGDLWPQTPGTRVYRLMESLLRR